MDTHWEREDYGESCTKIWGHKEKSQNIQQATRKTFGYWKWNDDDRSDGKNEIGEEESASLHDEMYTNKSFSDEEIYVTLSYHNIILRSYIVK